MFVLQKLLSRLLFPVPLTLIVGAVGLLVIARARAAPAVRNGKAPGEAGGRAEVSWPRRLGFALSGAALVFLWLASTAPLSDALLWSLEGRHPPVAQSSARSGGPDTAHSDDNPARLGPETGLAEAELIVVLGAGHAEREGFGPWASLGESARARVIEGVRLARRFELPLLFTGYAGVGEVSTAAMNARAAEELGVDPERIRVNSEPRNTAEEAAAVAAAVAGRPRSRRTTAPERVGSTTVILVTSASHMPRSVYLFEREGVAVIPAPADFRAAGRDYSAWGLLPSASALRNTERAWYEYLGLAWARLGG